MMTLRQEIVQKCLLAKHPHKRDDQRDNPEVVDMVMEAYIVPECDAKFLLDGIQDTLDVLVRFGLLERGAFLFDRC